MIGPNWKSRASCLDSPDLHFDPGGTIDRSITSIHTRLRRWRAKQVCATCPVRRECLAHSVRSEAVYGVFGGLDQQERQYLRNGNRLRGSNRPGFMAELAERLHMDGVDWEEIADLLGQPVDRLRRSLHDPGKLLSLREYAAWPAAWAGASAPRLAAEYALPLGRADEMVRAVRVAREEDRADKAIRGEQRRRRARAAAKARHASLVLGADD